VRAIEAGKLHKESKAALEAHQTKTSHRILARQANTA